MEINKYWSTETKKHPIFYILYRLLYFPVQSECLWDRDYQFGK